MHCKPMRLGATLVVAGTVSLLVGCGNRVDLTSSSDDDGVGTAAPVEQIDSADHDPGTSATDDPENSDRTDADVPEPRPTEQRPELGRPEDVVLDIGERLQERKAAGHGDRDEVLEMLEPLDRAPIPERAVGIRDGRTINEAGELNHLDGAAALACGDVERALSAMDDSDDRGADALLVSAADRASQSAVDDIVAWSTTLADAPERAEDIESLLGFLTVCTRGGYEL